MSVFTEINLEQAREIAKKFFNDTIISLEEIIGGVSNSNYFISTKSQQLVLTIIEELQPQALTQILTFINFLADSGICCPQPLKTADGELFALYQQKAVTITPKINGKDITNPSIAQIEQVAALTAKLHQLGAAYPHPITNSRDYAWRKQMAQQLLPLVSASQQQLLQHLMGMDNKIAWQQLPTAVCHLDLFKDNVFFEKHQLSGVIDFYYAATAARSYDLAITINDWCFDDKAKLQLQLYNKFVTSYTNSINVTAIEKQHWQQIMIISAFRFWLSRLWDYHQYKDNNLVTTKNPNHFEQIINQLLDNEFGDLSI